MCTILVPENLTFDDSIRNLPGGKIGTKARDILRYFISVVVKQSLKHGGYNSKHKGFIPLNAELLRKVHHKYNEYMGYLVAKGYLICDNVFTIGLKSYGYMLSDELTRRALIKVELEDFQIRCSVKTLEADGRTERKEQIKPFKHIAKWYLTGKLEIDVEAARRWADSHLDQELISCAGNQKQCDAKRQAHKASYWFIDKIATKSVDILDLKPCAFGGRLHGMFTYHNKGLRNYTCYDGKPLVSLDIKNSQPYFSTLLLDREFWKCEKNSTDKLRLSKIDKELYRRCREDQRIYRSTMLQDSAETLAQRRVSVGKFRKSVIEGTLYEEYEKALHSRLSCEELAALADRVYGRDAVKQEAIATLYERPNRLHLDYYLPSRVLMDMFPEVFILFNTIKSNTFFTDGKNKPHSLLAKIIQLAESHCVLKVIAKRIAVENPDLPIFTIHDSVVTIQGNEEYVTNVMKEELLRLVGVAPQIKAEHWEASEANTKSIETKQ